MIEDTLNKIYLVVNLRQTGPILSLLQTGVRDWGVARKGNCDYATIPRKNSGSAGSEKEKKEKYLNCHADSHKHANSREQTMIKAWLKSPN
jgi:hypothetical protein